MDYMPIIEIRVNQLAKEIAGSICSQELAQKIEDQIKKEFKLKLRNLDGYLKELVKNEIDYRVIQQVKNYFVAGSKGYEKIDNKVIELLDKELKIDNSPKKR
jgi:hypothetical protein